MKIRDMVLCITAIVYTVGCAPGDRAGTAGVKLLEIDREFSNMSEREAAAEAFRRYMAEDALQLPDGGEPVSGRNLIYSNMREGQENYTLTWKPEDSRVAKSGELGYTWGTYTLSSWDSAEIKRYTFGKYLNIWEKQADDSWKVIVDMGNQSPRHE